MPGDPHILVGVDGSECSIAALRWAAAQAKLTRSRLCALIAWEFPLTYGYPVTWPDGATPEDIAKAVLEEAIEKALGPHPKEDVVRVVVEGHPAPALCAASEGASLVVVGSRGHGEFVGMLIGSVSEFLAAHAHCPVVIVR